MLFRSNASEIAAVKLFSKVLFTLIKESNPAKFYNGRGHLLYAKYDLDLEHEINSLLEINDNAEND